MWLLPDLDSSKHIAGVTVRLGPGVRAAVIPLMLLMVDTGLVINLNRIRFKLLTCPRPCKIVKSR